MQDRAARTHLAFVRAPIDGLARNIFELEGEQIEDVANVATSFPGFPRLARAAGLALED